MADAHNHVDLSEKDHDISRIEAEMSNPTPPTTPAILQVELPM